VRTLYVRERSLYWIRSLGSVVDKAGECGDTVVDREARDRRSLDILSVKKEAKPSASEVNDVEVGRDNADLRQNNLLTGAPLLNPGTSQYSACCGKCWWSIRIT